jgi:hypothetical protein
MRFLIIAFLSVAGLSGLGNAYNSARVSNRCSDTIYLRSVRETDGYVVSVNPGSTYSEQFTGSHGVAIKIAKTWDDIGLSGLNFAYDLPGTAVGGVNYELTSIGGNPFLPSPIYPSDSSCPDAFLNGGGKYCSNIITDLTLTVNCPHNGYIYSEDSNQGYEDQSLKSIICCD